MQLIKWFKQPGTQARMIAARTKEEFILKQTLYGPWAIVGLQQYVNTHKTDQYLQDVIDEKKTSKLYFDIDVAVNLDNQLQADELGTEHMRKAIALVENTFANARCFCTADFTKEKFSIHIIVPNYTATLTGRKAVKTLVYTEAYQDLFFDANPYDRNDVMKGPNQSKGDGRTHEMVPNAYPDSLQLEKYLILCGFDESVIDVLSVLPDPEPKIDSKGKTKVSKLLDFGNLPSLKCQYPETSPPWENCTSLQKLQLIPCCKFGEIVDGKNAHLTHETTVRLLWWARSTGITWDDFWSWARQKNDTFAYHQKQLREWNAKTFYTVTDVSIYQLAHEAYGEKIVKSSIEEQMKKHFEIAPTHWLKDRRYLKSSDISNDAKFSILGVGCGGNKTGASLDFIKQIIASNPGLKVLWLVPRIALASDTIVRANALDITLRVYTEVRTKPEFTNMTLWSVQSLHKLEGHKFDIVVLEEVETLFKSFDGDCTTHNSNLMQNWELLKLFCANARKVIALDAYITRPSFDFFTSLKGSNERVEIIDSVIKAPELCLKYEAGDKYGCATLIGSLMIKLRKGKKVFIYVPYKTKNKVMSTSWLVDVASKHFGWKRGTQRSQYYFDQGYPEKKSVFLTGENYFHIILPDIRFVDNFDTNSQVSSIATKYDLTNLQGFVLYDGINIITRYVDNQTIKSLRIQLKCPGNQLVSLQGLNYALQISIVED